MATVGIRMRLKIYALTDIIIFKLGLIQVSVSFLIEKKNQAMFFFKYFTLKKTIKKHFG